MTTLKTPTISARWLRLIVVALAVFPTFGAAFAQSEDMSPDDMLPPPRLSVVEGAVRYWRPDADDWDAAPLNAAMADGDIVSTGESGRAEIQVGSRDFVRLTGDTALTLLTHDAGLMRFSVDSGTASFDLRSTRSGQTMQIDTPNLSIATGGQGYYRVFVGDGETRLIVRRGGRATLSFPSGRDRTVVAGEEAVVLGDDGSRFEVSPAPSQDRWDRWNDARSEYYATSASNRYVSPDVYGAADLDQYGRWREDRTYGWIWVPGVASSWAPYSAGSWHWDPVFGWTWVDSAPWGWTTSHYGRWVRVGSYWAWAPGPRGARVTYAPALVTFIGSGSSVGWVALGWGEPVLPWWGRPSYRGKPWWGGWGGPRKEYREDHRYSNRDVRNAYITGRDHDFDRYRGRGVTPPVTRGGRPFDSDRRRDRPAERPLIRPDSNRTPVFVAPQRDPGANPQYRHETPRNQPDRVRERRETPPPNLRLPTSPASQPREQRPERQRIDSQPQVATPRIVAPVQERRAPQERESRPEQPRMSPRAPEQRPQERRESSRESALERSIRGHLPGRTSPGDQN